MTQPVVGWRRAGLNFADINVVRQGIEKGKSLVQIQTELYNIDPAAVEKCFKHYAPKAPPPPSLDDELGGVRPSKKKG